MDFDKGKFKKLVHYVCRKTSADPDKLGLVKLHKILWYSEGRSYVARGESLTGETYIKKQRGPFSTHLPDIIKELEKEGELFTRKVDYHGYEKMELIGKGEPDLSLFTDSELRTIDSIIDQICDGQTAASISEKSHDEIWEMAADGEPLPIAAMLVARLAPITDEDIAWANEEIAKLH